jgi:hypothetical protein
MEPIALVLAALAAGASKGIGDTTATATRDAYVGLRDALKRLFKGRPSAEDALERYVTDPQSDGGRLAAYLEAYGVDTDETIIEAAERVTASVRGSGNEIRADNVYGSQQGTDNVQVNYFGQDPRDSDHGRP